MVRHTLLFIYRNFRRFRSTFVINLLGLSTGLVCVLLIYLWVQDELKVDRFHQKDKQLFQVMANHQESDGITTMPWVPGLLGEAMEEEIPEVEYAVSSSGVEDAFTLSFQEHHVKARGQLAGAAFFQLFSYRLVQGDPGQVLQDKHAVVLSEAMAIKLFGTTEDVVGKVATFAIYDVEKEVSVTGLFEAPSAPSSDPFDFVLSYELFREILGDRIHWGNYNALLYLQLEEGTRLEQFNTKISGFVRQKADWSNITLFARPYSDRYLYGSYENGRQAGGRIVYVRLFSAIAVFILLIACINFMNLSTARASARVKEVGIRKAVGAGRHVLVFQYLGESVLMAFVSLLLAVVLISLALPHFNFITGKQLSLHLHAGLALPVLGIVLLTGLLAGSYPALYLSGFNPAVVLKGKFSSATGELWARKGLVVFQFALSVMLMVSVVVVYRQIEFVQSKNLGYERDNVVYFEKDGKLQQNHQAFLAALKELPGVAEASAIGQVMVGQHSFTTGLEWEGKKPDEIIRFSHIDVDYDMIETLGIELAAGRSFSRDFGADSSRIMFNQAAIDAMGLTDPVGKTVRFWGEDREIIGVVQNFHFESLHEQVKPLLFVLRPDNTWIITARIKAGSEKETLQELQQLYRAYNPGFAFNYHFLEQDYQALYAAEQRVAVLSRYFAGLAVLISCLGLFGLAAFTAERRLKEIGIRKILGSSSIGIIYLLSRDFTSMVVVATAIGLPLSFFIAQAWLESFAFRIALEWWYFAGAGLLALLIAWFTVGLQMVKVTRINPARCLRDE